MPSVLPVLHEYLGLHWIEGFTGERGPKVCILKEQKAATYASYVIHVSEMNSPQDNFTSADKGKQFRRLILDMVITIEIYFYHKVYQKYSTSDTAKFLLPMCWS